MHTLRPATEITDFSQFLGFEQIYICDLNEFTMTLAELLHSLGLPVAGFVRPDGPARALTSLPLNLVSVTALAELSSTKRTALVYSDELVATPEAWRDPLGHLPAVEVFDPWLLMKPFKEVNEWAYIVSGIRHFGNMENGVFFDVGANNGVTSQMAIDHYKTIYAFEPSPVQQEKFNQRFASQTTQSDVNLVTYALGRADQRGTQTFYLDDSEAGGGSSLLKESTEKHSRESGMSEMTVEVKTLGDACQELGAVPTFLKLDVEGSEPDVIFGGTEVIEAHKPVILFECWRHSWGEGVRDLVQYLKQQGYTVKCSYIGGDMWDVFELGAPLNYVTNALCTPPQLEFPPLL